MKISLNAPPASFLSGILMTAIADPETIFFPEDVKLAFPSLPRLAAQWVLPPDARVVYELSLPDSTLIKRAAFF